jgi:hypothetical protein
MRQRAACLVEWIRVTVTVNSDDSGQPIAIDPRPDYEFHQISSSAISFEGRPKPSFSTIPFVSRVANAAQ